MPELNRKAPDRTETAGDDPPDAVGPGDIRMAAMDLLARREHSRRELGQKLLKRFGDSELIEAQLDRLAEENLQCDARYAESFLRQRIGRGYGPARIRQEMRQKGIGDSAISAAMDAQTPDWFELAEIVYRKKFGSPSGEKLTGESRQDYQRVLKERAKRIRFLQYRGFADEHFRHLLED